MSHPYSYMAPLTGDEARYMKSYQQSVTSVVTLTNGIQKQQHTTGTGPKNVVLSKEKTPRKLNSRV